MSDVSNYFQGLGISGGYVALTRKISNKSKGKNHAVNGKNIISNKWKLEEIKVYESHKTHYDLY